MTTHKKEINPLDVIAQHGWNEGDDLEFKSAKGGLPGSLWKTYSAMANTNGGIILLGVENDGTVSGVIDSQRIKKSFWDTVNNKSKVSANLLNEDDVQEHCHPDGTVLAIRIPRASRYQRPIFLELNPLTGTYRRNHEGDYHCTEKEVSRMLTDKSEEPADSRILVNFTMDDLDLNSFQQYRQQFRSYKPNHPWLSEDDKGLLTKLGGWKICRETNRCGLTVSGLLMFGREETIREGIPQYSIDYREKYSDNPEVRWTDRLTLDGTWSGNLFQFYLRLIQKLATDLKLPFQLDENLFRKGETVVHEAIREALVNSLIHADYSGLGGIIIEKYKDRFEFSNPGNLLISFDQLVQGNVSECRNKSLQTMFTMIGAAEKAGSGVDKIRRGWSSQHWRFPRVEECTQPDRVQWILPMVSLIPVESLDRLKQRFGNKFQKFTPLEVQALVTADLEEWVDNARLRQITLKHSTEITKLFQKLVDEGCLIQDRQGRWARYRLSVDSDSVHKNIDSVHKDRYSVHKTKIPDDEWDELLALAEFAKKNRRLSYEQLETILLNLCQKHYLTRNQLAQLVERNADSLRFRFLTPMVEKGLLRLRFPEKPNRTDQAYIKTEKQ